MRTVWEWCTLLVHDPVRCCGRLNRTRTIDGSRPDIPAKDVERVRFGTE
jgi:hypothetical protein